MPNAVILTGGSIRSTSALCGKCCFTSGLLVLLLILADTRTIGDITYRKIIGLLPFKSGLVLLRVTGRVLLDTIADALTQNTGGKKTEEKSEEENTEEGTG